MAKTPSPADWAKAKERVRQSKLRYAAALASAPPMLSMLTDHSKTQLTPADKRRRAEIVREGDRCLAHRRQLDVLGAVRAVDRGEPFAQHTIAMSPTDHSSEDPFFGDPLVGVREPMTPELRAKELAAGNR